jgi:hypothetical protein
MSDVLQVNFGMVLISGAFESGKNLWHFKTCAKLFPGAYKSYIILDVLLPEQIRWPN